MVLGFSVGMEAFDELLSINVPWSQEFSDVLRFLDLSLLPLVFSLIITEPQVFSIYTSPMVKHLG